MKVLVLSSGGVDSSTCLALATNKFGKENVTALSMYYGQKHDRELEAAEQLAEHYGVEHIVMNLTPIFRFSNSSLLKNSEEEIPEGSYSSQQNQSKGKPVSTYVPFRNGLFLSCAASIALSKECEIIYYGAHSDDVAGNAYPDCSTAFNDAINKAIFEGSGRQLHIEAPFINMNKADVVKKGLELNVPFELTWSCYEGGDEPCGVCATCLDRAEAFKLNGVKDPVIKG
ncbi:MAG: 7-cyano-7-deazaguanine synthase QueC [Anaerovoracaceae bacterium]